MNAIAALFLTIACTSSSQIFQKKAALNLDRIERDHKSSLVQFLLNPNLILSAILLGSGFVAWLWVLAEWDVSAAYPFLSLNLVVVMIASKLIFSEKMASHQWVGAMSIIAGVILISGGGVA